MNGEDSALCPGSTGSRISDPGWWPSVAVDKSGTATHDDVRRELVPVTITEVRSTERFVGTPELPRQVLHVTIERSMRDGEIRLEVTGTEPPGSVFATDVRGALTVPAGDRAVRVDVPLDLPERAGVGDEIAVRVSAASDGGDEADAYGTVVVAEPGWTMVMVSHFHYDPVWWNTQAAYTTDWDFVGTRLVDATGVRRQRVRARRGAPQARACAIRTTTSSWPSSTTSSRTSTPTRSSERCCGGCSPRAGWSSSAAPTTSRTPT